MRGIVVEQRTLNLEEVARGSSGRLTGGTPARELSGVSIDSRTLEPGQELRDRTIPFDDREVARNALRRLGAKA